MTVLNRYRRCSRCAVASQDDVERLRPQLPSYAPAARPKPTWSVCARNSSTCPLPLIAVSADNG